MKYGVMLRRCGRNGFSCTRVETTRTWRPMWMWSWNSAIAAAPPIAAARVLVAGTPTVSSSKERLQIDRLLLVDLVEVNAIDVFSKCPLLTPVRPKKLQGARGAFRGTWIGIFGQPDRIYMDEGGRTFVRRGGLNFPLRGRERFTGYFNVAMDLPEASTKGRSRMAVILGADPCGSPTVFEYPRIGQGALGLSLGFWVQFCGSLWPRRQGRGFACSAPYPACGSVCATMKIGNDGTRSGPERSG